MAQFIDEGPPSIEPACMPALVRGGKSRYILYIIFHKERGAPVRVSLSERVNYNEKIQIRLVISANFKVPDICTLFCTQSSGTFSPVAMWGVLSWGEIGVR